MANSADAKRLQRTAEKSGKSEDWLIAADAWREAGFEHEAELCEIKAGEAE